MAKQGCDNHCETCSSANHAYCAVMIAKSNQQMLMKMQEIVVGMRETKVYMPIQEGEIEVPEDNKN